MVAVFTLYKSTHVPQRKEPGNKVDVSPHIPCFQVLYYIFQVIRSLNQTQKLHLTMSSHRGKTSDSLVKHKKAHSGNKSYECDFCKKRFTHSCNLVSHRRIHTGDKPYECDVCIRRDLESLGNWWVTEEHTLERDLMNVMFVRKDLDSHAT